MGVVYYANYFIWFEVGRCELLRAAGSSYEQIEASGIRLPVIEAHCEYRQPARYDDELEIRTKGVLLSPVRVEFRYEVVRVGDDAVCAAGHTRHAAVDLSGRPCRLPRALRSLFA